MNKKDKMLAHITNNVRWFMTTSSLEVIPCYELSASVFSRVKQYIAEDVEYSDIVCLISTSILDTGKSGVLFTVNHVYSKAWGILTGNYQNSIYASDWAEFGQFNEFKEDRMKEIMDDLAEIAIEEDAREAEKNIKEMIGSAVLGGMAATSIVSMITDALVSQNNEQIRNESDQMNNDVNIQDRFVMRAYTPFFPLINSFLDLSNKLDDSEEMDEEIFLKFINCLNDLFTALSLQADCYVNITPDSEECEQFIEWSLFWALMFTDSNQFKDRYNNSDLEYMPEIWNVVIGFMDQLLEDEEWDVVLSDECFDFGNRIINNNIALLELLNNSGWDEECQIPLREILDSDIQAVNNLSGILHKTIDYLSVFTNSNV